ncbi:glycosyltransferase [Dermatobacter hominis]|uniref:glycosyltransferase n=1 Tax=Dermatobacter hominis TaxID=2884263 RepID=UPI0035ABDE61
MVSEHASPLAVLGGVDAGGQNVHVGELARHLAQMGVDVDVYTRRDDPDLPRVAAFAPGVLVHHLDAGPAEAVPKDRLLPHMPAMARELQVRLDARPVELVHSHFWMSGLAAVTAASASHTPVVHTFHALGVVKRRHQGADDTSPPERIGIERSLLRECDAIIATCSDERRELLDLGARPEAVHVVPCGVDASTFRPNGPSFEWRTRHLRVLAAGRPVPRKGVAELIAAVARVPDVELVVAGGPPLDRLGSDPELVHLHGLARSLGCSGRVRFVGAVGRRAMADLARSADVVACTPWYEPFGIVPLEAMASGVPVLVSGVGGMLDTVVHDVTGLHVRPRDVNGIAAALERLQDPELRRRLGRAGRKRVTEHFTWDRVARATLDAYQRTVSASRVLGGVA